MKEELLRFFLDNDIATVCCVTEDGYPHCFNCYYAFDDKEYVLLFKSSPKSYHSQLLEKNTAVAGTILLDASNLMKAKGMQFSGKVLPPEVTEKLSKIYYKKNPLAYAKPGELWAVRLEWAKFTNNTLGIGSKQEWFLNEETIF